MNHQTIIYFKGVYDTLDAFTDSLIEAFSQMGYPSFVYDAAKKKESEEALYELLSGRTEKPDRSVRAAEGNAACGDSAYGAAQKEGFAVVTFNNMGYNLPAPQSVSDAGPGKSAEDGAGNLWEYYGIPYINILMDHPFHYDRPLRNAPSTAIVLCTDRNHVKYIRRFYKNIRQSDFLPHAGTELRCKHKPLSARSIDVIYAGALPAYTASAMIPDLKSIEELDAEAMTGEVLRDLAAHPDKTTEQAIEEYVKAAGICLEDGSLHDLIVKMRFLDSYATSFFREQAVRILVESGIHVTVYGAGWEQCGWCDHPYFTYGGLIPALEVPVRMNDSKIVLNTMTWFKAGAHDRIFNGMLAGAAVVTDDSSYLRREFTDGKELVMFQREEIRSLPDRVSDLFGHLGRAQEMADFGYETAKRCHTWKERAAYIEERFFPF